jgi:hypothetical protein
MKNNCSEFTSSIAGPAGSTSDGAFSWANAGPEVELCPEPAELEEAESGFFAWAKTRAGTASSPTATTSEETAGRAIREFLQFNIILKSSPFLPPLWSVTGQKQARKHARKQARSKPGGETQTNRQT